MSEERPWSPPVLGRPRPRHAARAAPPPPPRRRPLLAVLALLSAAAVVAVVAFVMLGDDAQPSPDTDLPPPPDRTVPSVASGEQLRRPLPSPDRYTEPVRCDGFSPEGRAELGRDPFVSEPVTRSSGEVAMTCTFPGGSGVVVQTSTYPSDPSGEGLAAVWDRLEDEFPAGEGIAALGDGALFNATECRMFVAHSNALLILLGNITSDPAACRAELVRFAEDFAAETFG